jgi:uncharacterized protein YnzC (UPF0291/DUF896 family)
VQELAAVLNLISAIVQSALTADLGLAKQSACRVPNTAQKEERVKHGEEFLQIFRRQSSGVLDNIEIMDEFTLSFHTPKMKQESKQWMQKKG